jgi:hypothetical protein
MEALGLGELTSINLDGATVELAKKTNGTEYIKITLEDGKVLEVRRVNPIQAVST